MLWEILTWFGEFYGPGLEVCKPCKWWPGQAIRAGSVHGKGQGALKLCQLQRKVKLHPEVLASSKGESSLTGGFALGKVHLSSLPQGEVKMSVKLIK